MTETKIVLTVTHKKPLPAELLHLVEHFPEVFIDEEIWRQHPIHIEYEVSSLGNIRRKEGQAIRSDGTTAFVRGGPIRPAKMPNGYLSWHASEGGKHKTSTVHRAVLTAFYGLASEEKVGCHLNGVRDDNRLLNLRWGTRQENEADKVRHGTAQRGSGHGGAKLSPAQVLAIRADARTGVAIAAEYGIHQQTVSRIKRGQRWAHLGRDGVEAGVTAELLDALPVKQMREE